MLAELVGVASLVAVHVVALLAGDGGLGSLRDVARTRSLAARPALLGGATVAALLVLLGSVFGYALYVVVFGLGTAVVHGLVGGGGPLDLLVLVGASLALGASVFYTTVAGVHAFGLAARDAVAAVDAR